MRVLLVNDDGIDSPGVRLLRELLMGLGHGVTLVAPAREQSGTSCSVTFLHSFHVEPLRENGEVIGWRADGTPVDCVKVGLRLLMSPAPDVVISGVNRGMNAGGIVFYSGTVGAAFEAWLQGVPALAISKRDHATSDFGPSLEVCRRILPRLLPWVAAHGRLVFNMNVPAGRLEDIRGVRWTRMDLSAPSDHYEAQEEENGRLTLQSVYRREKPEPDKNRVPTDLAALEDGWVTITPMSLDLTAHQVLSAELPALGETWEHGGLRAGGRESPR